MQCAASRVADGGEALQIWWVAANILNRLVADSRQSYVLRRMAEG
jgi:hypothetical protein